MTHMCVVLGRVLLNFKHISLNLTNAIYGVGKYAKTNQVMRLTYLVCGLPG